MPPGTGGVMPPASGSLLRRALLRFRLRASDFLGRQKVTKDRFKDPWSLKISFPSRPVPCLPLDPALREPTRPSPACCRLWTGKGPPATDGKARCVDDHRDVGLPAWCEFSGALFGHRSRSLPARRVVHGLLKNAPWGMHRCTIIPQIHPPANKKGWVYGTVHPALPRSQAAGQVFGGGAEASQVGLAGETTDIPHAA